jgi:hypothetical protein
MPVVKLTDHRKALMANLSGSLAPGHLESEGAKRIARDREKKIEGYRNSIKFYASRLAEAEGENAADEWLTQCMSGGVK